MTAPVSGEDSPLATKCLDFCKDLASQGHTVQDVYKVASKNNAHTQFWSQHSYVRPKHFKNPHPLPAKDGSLVTGASQDHFVGFHHLTILTGQGDIKEFLVMWKLRSSPSPFIFRRRGHKFINEDQFQKESEGTYLIDFIRHCQDYNYWNAL